MARDFKSVTTPKINLDSVKRAPITDLTNNNFAQIGNLLLNLLISEKDEIQSVNLFDLKHRFGYDAVSIQKQARGYTRRSSFWISDLHAIKLVF